MSDHIEVGGEKIQSLAVEIEQYRNACEWMAEKLQSMDTMLAREFRVKLPTMVAEKGKCHHCASLRVEIEQLRTESHRYRRTLQLIERDLGAEFAARHWAHDALGEHAVESATWKDDMPTKGAPRRLTAATTGSESIADLINQNRMMEADEAIENLTTKDANKTRA